MTLILFILIAIVCIILGLIILIQNPKGGGLSGTLAGFNNQFMGVKQTTDVLEKGTWIFAAVIGILCIISTVFIPDSRRTQVQAPQTQGPVQGPAPAQTPNR